MVDPREIGPITPLGDREGACAIYGCPNRATVLVRIAAEDAVFDVELCEEDRHSFDEGDIGVVLGEEEL